MKKNKKMFKSLIIISLMCCINTVFAEFDSKIWQKRVQKSILTRINSFTRENPFLTIEDITNGVESVIVTGYNNLITSININNENINFLKKDVRGYTINSLFALDISNENKALLCNSFMANNYEIYPIEVLFNFASIITYIEDESIAKDLATYITDALIVKFNFDQSLKNELIEKKLVFKNLIITDMIRLLLNLNNHVFISGIINNPTPRYSLGIIEQRQVNLIKKIIIKQSEIQAKKHLRDIGKTFVIVDGVNPVIELMTPIVDALNAPLFIGIEEALNNIGYEIEMIDRTNFETCVSKNKEDIFYGIIKPTNKILAILYLGLGVEEYNNFIKIYNEGENN